MLLLLLLSMRTGACGPCGVSSTVLQYRWGPHGEQEREQVRGSLTSPSPGCNQTQSETPNGKHPDETLLLGFTESPGKSCGSNEYPPTEPMGKKSTPI